MKARRVQIYIHGAFKKPISLLHLHMHKMPGTALESREYLSVDFFSPVEIS